jgi:hypothetical protein
MMCICACGRDAMQNPNELFEIRKPTSLAYEPEAVKAKMREVVETERSRIMEERRAKRAFFKDLAGQARGSEEKPLSDELANTIRTSMRRKLTADELGLNFKNRANLRRRRNLARPNDTSICNSKYVPYDSTFIYAPGGIGGLPGPGEQDYINATDGTFGGSLYVVDFGDYLILETGLGGWVFSGTNDGIVTASAEVAVWGRCQEVAFFSYAHNIVTLYITTYDDFLNPNTSSISLRDDSTVFGWNTKTFSGDNFMPNVGVSVSPGKFYFVWAWVVQGAEASTSLISDAVQDLHFSLYNLEICGNIIG